MIELKKAGRMYRQGNREVYALRDVSLLIKSGEFLSIMGPSGSGKSTLLNLMGGLDQPSSGEVFMDGKPLHGISDYELTLIRRRRVGFIFQFFNLLPLLTAEENVGLAPGYTFGPGSDEHFRKMYDEYHRLDDAVYRIEEEIDFATDQEIEELKMRRAKLKDYIYHLLRHAPTPCPACLGSGVAAAN